MHGYWKFDNYSISYYKGYYKNGKKHGLWEEESFYEIEKGHYKNGVREGWWIWEDSETEIIDKKGKVINEFSMM